MSGVVGISLLVQLGMNSWGICQLGPVNLNLAIKLAGTSEIFGASKLNVGGAAAKQTV